MRIKIPFFEYENDKLQICHNYEEYQVKLKCEKNRLHTRYISSIAIGICVWLFAEKTNAPDFIAQFSFAGTITSIILSVVAIIMSITGEGKSDHIKEQLSETAKGINKSQKELNDINAGIVKNLNDLNMQVGKLHEEINRLPEMVAKTVGEEFEKNRKSENDIKTKNSPDTQKQEGWEK